MKKTIYLIDGTSYIHRAYHALDSLSNSQGFPTNAIFVFTRMILKLVDDKNPEYLAMLFDTKGKTFRHEMYEEYKANRKPLTEDLIIQIPHIKEVVEAFNIPAFELQGYEADDLIGTLAKKAEAAGFSVVMITGDKDFFQLITENITMWDPMKETTSDITTIRETFGIEPAQMVDLMALSGDNSDHIPGIPGIGEKTAPPLIQKFGNLENLYSRIGEITKKKQHENLLTYKEQAFLSRKLATIDTAVPLSFDLESLRRKEPDNAKLSKLFRKFEFRQLQQRFPETEDRSQKDYKGIFDSAALANLIERLKTADYFALDTETTSTDPMKAKLVGFSFSVQADEAFYIPCCHDYLGVPEQLRLETVIEQLKPVLENPNLKKIGQNIKYDWMVMLRHGISLNGVIFDTMVASYLLNPSKRAHNLDQISLDYLNYKKITYQEVAPGKNMGFEKVPVEKGIPYACEDADTTLMAYHVLNPKLQEIGLTQLLETVEMPLVPVLMKMEMKGISVNKEKLRELSKLFESQLAQLEGEIYDVAGEIFNINSPKQVGYILFEKLNLKPEKKTKKKTGYSTDVEVLTSLAMEHELPALILRHRTLSKLKSTYADALADLIHPETKRIHTSYNQTVTATGRLSSSEPNLQNIPIRTEEGIEIRRAFIPKEGWSLVSADYSQIELRILAHYSEDEILMQSFIKDEDIHTRTGAEVFQISPDMITPELRRQAKVINFGIIYGMSAFGLSKELGIGNKMAQTYIDNYFERYKGVKQFTDQMIEEARETKQTSTLLGRIRLLPEINSSNKNIRQFAERMAINTPIQGTAADLIKVAMINADAEFEKKGLKSAMLLSVHDELVFEVPPKELEMVKSLIKKIMEGVWSLNVPLKVNVAVGKNWAEAH